MPQQKLKLTVKGLYTHPNLLSEVPEGALVRADNIVIDRPGIAESRRGMKQYNSAISSEKKLFNFQEKLLVHDGTTLKYDNSGAWTSLSGSFDGPATGRRIQSIQFNKNFYFTSNLGVYKMVSPTSVPEKAGAPAGLDLNAALVAGDFFATNTAVAYRIVWGTRDTNENLVLGAPSARVEISNASGTTKAVELNFTIPAGLTTSWFYQVYRSLMSVDATVPGDDELLLAKEVALTSGDITAGTITVTDNVSEDLLGASLYTNSTQDGILKPNDRPPFAVDISSFREHAFYFNTKQPQFLVLTMIKTPANDKTVTIDGDVYTAKASETIASAQFKSFSPGSVVASDIMDTVQSLIRVINRYSGNTGIYAYYLDGGSFYISKRDFGSGYTANCNETGIFQEVLPLNSTDDAHKNRLYISKEGIADAVPRLQYLDVGRKDKEGLRCVGVRDALFLLKEDGVWRLTGTSVDNFLLEPHDTTFNFLAPETAAAFANTVFAASNQGIVSINTSGVQLVGIPIQSELLRIIQLSNFDALAWGASYDGSRKYLLGVPNAESSSGVEQIFVYNDQTQSWTRFPLAWKHALTSEADDKLYALRITDHQALQERKNLTIFDYVDDEYSVTINAVSDNVLTLSSVANAVVGYAIKQSAQRGVITAINGNDVTVNTNPGYWSTGAATIYKPIDVDIQWAPDHAENPGVLKHYSDISFLFENVRFQEIDFMCSSNFRNGFLTTTLRSVATAGWGAFPFGSLPWGTARGGFQGIRTFYPREACRALWVNIRMKVSQPFSALSLSGVSYMATVMSSRFK